MTAAAGIASRAIAEPRPGFFRLRLVAGGVYVPCRLFRPCRCTVTGGDTQAEHPWTAACDRHPPLMAEIGAAPPSADLGDVERVWTAEPVAETEWRRLHLVAAWAREHAPDAPEAAPARPVDRLTARIPF